jgi:1-acyl-sn-glycerol-3-phosphate acyltransferase
MPWVVWIMYRLVKIVLWLPSRLYRSEIVGKEHLPKSGGYILAANHLGWLDTILLPINLRPQLSFAAKAELYKHPGLKQLLELTGTISVTRKDATLSQSRKFRQEAEAAMKQGRVLAIFPEGTRSRSGHLLAFEPGVGVIAVQTKRLVVPVGISYSKGVLWPPARPKIRIVIGEPLDSSSYKSKELTVELRRRIAALSGAQLAEDVE